MNQLSDPAFWAGVAGVIAAVTALVTALRTKGTVTNHIESVAEHTQELHTHVDSSAGRTGLGQSVKQGGFQP